jgi:hypothetical protein
VVALEFVIFYQDDGRCWLGLIQQFEEFFPGFGRCKSRGRMQQHHHAARRQEGGGVDGSVERLEIQTEAAVEAGNVHVRGGGIAQTST